MRLVLGLAATAVLAACNPSGSQNAQNNASTTFPDGSAAAYRIEAVAHHENGSTMPIVMARDGQKLRMEFSNEDGATTIISNGETNESYVIGQAQGRTFAMRADMTGSGQFEDPIGDWRGELAQDATRTGACSGAGENGEEWTQTTEAGVAKTACVTSDGIILGATEGGRTVWETTSVQRGAQPAELFTLPPGVQVMDLGNMGGVMDAIQKAQGD